MKTYMFIFVALLSSVAFADDLVLKNGQRLTWKSIADEGDSYTVITKDGKSVTIKKTEVERIATGSEEPAKPLTGATFTLDMKKAVTVDLLPKAKTEATNGAWKSTPGLLSNTGTNPGRVTLSFDCEVPEEYDLNIRIERGGGDLGFEVGVVEGDQTGAFHFDSFHSLTSMFGMISGEYAAKTDGQFFKPGKARNVRIAVRRDAILVQADGKDLWKSRVDWKAITLFTDVPAPEKRKLFLCAAGGAWKVQSFTLSHAK